MCALSGPFGILGYAFCYFVTPDTAANTLCA
jgi:hypothetical protein